MLQILRPDLQMENLQRTTVAAKEIFHVKVCKPAAKCMENCLKLKKKDTHLPSLLLLPWRGFPGP